VDGGKRAGGHAKGSFPPKMAATPRSDNARSGNAAFRTTIDTDSGELLLPGAPRTAGIPFCCPVGSNRAILE
jgi:hypothetical protein